MEEKSISKNYNNPLLDEEAENYLRNAMSHFMIGFSEIAIGLGLFIAGGGLVIAKWLKKELVQKLNKPDYNKGSLNNKTITEDH